MKKRRTDFSRTYVHEDHEDHEGINVDIEHIGRGQHGGVETRPESVV